MFVALEIIFLYAFKVTNNLYLHPIVTQTYTRWKTEGVGDFLFLQETSMLWSVKAYSHVWLYFLYVSCFSLIT